MRERDGSGADRSCPPREDPADPDQRIEDWLDAALEGTFPASDPVASPPDIDSDREDL